MQRSRQLTRASWGALGLALALSACSRGVVQRDGATALGALPSGLCVTSGAVRDLGEQTMEVEAPVFRGVVPGTTEPAVEVAFVYEGPTEQTVPLANGEQRRDISLKLRARDACNVIYVVWKVEPISEIAVLVKANPEQTRSAECRDGGYRRLEPETSNPAPVIQAGEQHVLGARIEDETIEVFADQNLVWKGKLPEDALAFEGPVGIRTDNGRFRFRMAGPNGPVGSTSATCDEHASG